MSETPCRVMCADCRHVWAAQWTAEQPAMCPRCASLASIESALPWSMISGQALRYLRHRLAGATIAEISLAHGTTVLAVRMTLSRAVGVLRRCGVLSVRSPHDLEILAAYARVPSLPVTIVTDYDGQAAEREAGAVG